MWKVIKINKSDFNLLIKRIVNEEKERLLSEKTNILNEEGPNELLRSIYSLAKNNNGNFKSEAQAAFLKRQIDLRDGAVGSHEVYGNSVTVFVEYDDKGITKIYTHSSKTNRDVVKFTRISDEQFKDNQDRFITNRNAEIERSKSRIAQNLQQRIDLLRNDMRELGDDAVNNPSIANTLNKAIARYELELADLERQLAEL
jgi:hypothetical protein